MWDGSKVCVGKRVCKVGGRGVRMSFNRVGRFFFRADFLGWKLTVGTFLFLGYTNYLGSGGVGGWKLTVGTFFLGCHEVNVK